MMAAMAEPQPRARRVRPVGELLPAVGGASFRRYGFMQVAIVNRWADIVGADYAKHSAPERIVFPHGKRAGGTLKVAVTGAFAPLLGAVAPQVVERVNGFFGYAAVARLALRHRDAPLPVRIAAAQPPAPPAAETATTLKAVADPELRGLLESLARSVATTRGPPRIG